MIQRGRRVDLPSGAFASQILVVSMVWFPGAGDGDGKGDGVLSFPMDWCRVGNGVWKSKGKYYELVNHKPSGSSSNGK